MANTGAGERNYCLDFVKGIACVFVVFMHCEFPGYLGTFVQCISRFCVPFFFMVSGYFCYRSTGCIVDYKKKLKHIGSITLGATIFYAIINGIATLIRGGGVQRISQRSALVADI
jgi:surface polysaccharide O-acyltransferase-like enzyme